MRVILIAVLGALGCQGVGEPFCDVARCAEQCIDGIGCATALDVDGVVHLFADGAERSLCGSAARGEAEHEHDDGTPCPECHGGER